MHVNCDPFQRHYNRSARRRRWVKPSIAQLQFHPMGCPALVYTFRFVNRTHKQMWGKMNGIVTALFRSMPIRSNQAQNSSPHTTPIDRTMSSESIWGIWRKRLTYVETVLHWVGLFTQSPSIRYFKSCGLELCYNCCSLNMFMFVGATGA